jgi:hypothetical protein
MKRHGLNPKEHDAVRKKLLFSNVLVEDMKVGIAENGSYFLHIFLSW